MQAAPLPEDEDDRLAALRALDVLDTPPEERFDRITRTAARLFAVPIALVSLVDDDRQWFKSCIGFDATATDRRLSFCAHAILRPDALVVPDARADPRFADNPLVTGEPHVRFYAGHPVRRAGHAVGTLCLIDREPRSFDAGDRAELADLVAWVEQELGAVDLQRVTADLARRNGQLARLLDSLPDAVATFDTTGALRSLNPAGEALFRRAEGDVVGTPVDALVVAEDRHVVADELLRRSGREVGELVHIEVRGQRGDGSCFPIDVLVGELEGAEGEVFIAVARDVTARHQVERMKDEFVSVVSHELRTPLTSIRASLGLLDAGKLGALEPTAARMVSIAAANSERLVRLVNDILDLERLRTGRMPLAPEPVAVAALCETAADAVAGVAEDAGTTIELAAPDAVVCADADRIVQVLTNLLGNAVKFAPPGSTVTVGGGVEGDEVVLRVADQGRGIPPDKIDAVFAPFVQVDASDAREKGGTGLGLAIAREIVDAHGGRIWASSPPGGGTVMTVALPAAPGDAPGGAA